MSLFVIAPDGLVTYHVLHDGEHSPAEACDRTALDNAPYDCVVQALHLIGFARARALASGVVSRDRRVVRDILRHFWGV